jgi:hypothetical protein
MHSVTDIQSILETHFLLTKPMYYSVSQSYILVALSHFVYLASLLSFNGQSIFIMCVISFCCSTLYQSHAEQLAKYCYQKKLQRVHALRCVNRLLTWMLMKTGFNSRSVTDDRCHVAAWVCLTRSTWQTKTSSTLWSTFLVFKLRL